MSAALACAAALASGVGSVAASASVSVASSAASLCPSAKHTYLDVMSAKHAARGAITLTGHRATIVCGGPDDWHFVDAKGTVIAHVLASAHVTVLTYTNAGIGTRRLHASQLVGFLPHDIFTRTFQVSGPLKKVNGLTEVYHP